MSNAARVVGAAAFGATLLCVGRSAAAQTVAEYARQVDSLARAWRAEKLDGASMRVARRFTIDVDSMRVGALVVVADSQYTELARAAASTIAPLVQRAYGASAKRMSRHPIVLRARVNAKAANEVQSGIGDSTGTIIWRSNDFANVESLVGAWRTMIEDAMTDDVGPDVRRWLRASIPNDSISTRTWPDARIALVLAASGAARRCAAGDVQRCEQALGVVPVDDPAFTLFDAPERLEMINMRQTILRRIDAAQFDRCTAGRSQPACDSVARGIPPDVVGESVPPAVRQSLVRFALATGGDGAFDRFAAAAATPRARLEAASNLPMDSLVSRWRATLMDAPRASTAVDLETALSSLAWAALCVGCALRSSRWR
jgi:hypothetical protein